MKLRFALIVGVVVVAVCGPAVNSWADARKEAEEARSSLRKQGFKTDLSEFNFSTDEATAARVAALTNVAYPRPTVLLRPCGTECALVAWKQPELEDEEGYQNLLPVEEILATNRVQLEQACAASLAGPIRFPLTATNGSAMLLVHLARLKSLSQALTARMLVELRAKRYSEAWTNLLAVSRLATAWEPEPTDISHLVRFDLVRISWKAAWQALQAHEWTEAQLLALQHEWAAPDFFKGLPETTAFARACAVDNCIRERQTPPGPGTPLQDTLKNAVQSPSSFLAETRYRWQRAQYRAAGSYEDEHDVLFFYRDRELELRKAIAATAWSRMRGLPGVTNAASFRSKYGSRMQMMLNNRQMHLGFQLEGKGLLGRAAEAEGWRRLVVAAIGLERYRVAHVSYPKALQSLVPEIMSNVPVDFMDGEPLRYRLGESGAFVLYSVGLDCVDDGGKLSEEKDAEYPRLDPFDHPDMVWPRAASDAEAQAFRLEQARAREELKMGRQRDEEERQRKAEARRQEIVTELARIFAKGENPKTPDPKIEGGLVSEVLRNKAIGGRPLRLDEMLTLRQVTAGKDPEIATFELALSYDALTNIGRVRLVCDADPNEGSSSDAPEVQECERATNGNCRLVWNTKYDPPGKHFVQAELSMENRRSRRRNDDDAEINLKGPLFAYVSTNVIQYFPLGDVYSDKGAFFHVKLAQPVGSYSLELTRSSGEHLHTITGSTTNGIVEVHWDLIDDGGKRYTNDTLNSSWTVKFPDPPVSGSVNTNRP